MTKLLVAHSNINTLNLLKGKFLAGNYSVQTAFDLYDVKTACEKSSFDILIAPDNMVKYSDVLEIRQKVNKIVIVKFDEGKTNLDIGLKEVTYHVKYENLHKFICSSSKENDFDHVDKDDIKTVEGILAYYGQTEKTRGYFYTVCAINMLSQSTQYEGMLTKLLYPSIARKYKTTPSAVEIGIRRVIKKICNNSNSRFDSGITNEEFLFDVAREINYSKCLLDNN